MATKFTIKRHNGSSWVELYPVTSYNNLVDVPSSFTPSTHTHSQYLTGITKSMVTTALGYTPPTTDTNTWRGIQNNLTSTSTTDSLSAAQGKVLKDAIDAINTALSSDDTDLDTIQEIVSYIKANKTTIDSITTSKQPKTLATALTINGTSRTTVEDALSALNTYIGTKTANTGTVTSITLSAGGGISLNATGAITTSGTRTITNTGVRSVSTGTANGTISVNTNGTSANVSVYGLGTAAYTNSSAYAASGHTHALISALESLTSSNKDTVGFVKVDNSGNWSVDNNTYLTSHQSLSNYSTKANTIKSLSISGKTITYTKGDDTTGTLTTQDTNTTYSAGTGLSLSSTTFSLASGVATAGTAGTSSATSGSTLAVPYVTVDTYGRVTGYGTHTHTISGFSASGHTHTKSQITDFESNAWLLKGGTAIPNNDTIKDLNSYTTFGNYYCDSNVYSQYIMNRPVSEQTAFILKVYCSLGSGNNYIRQDFYMYANNRRFTRWSANKGSTWSAWEEFSLVGHTHSQYLQSGSATSSSGKDGYIAFPDGGVYTTTSSSVTGALKISLPRSWTSCMLKFTVSIYNYCTHCSADYIIGGYPWGAGYWYNVSAYSQGYSNYSNLKVRFGHDGKKCCIYIGETNTTWYYPQVVVKDVQLGFNEFEYDKWKSGWSISFSSTLDGVQLDVANPAPARINHTHSQYLTSHQDISGKQDKITSTNKLAYSLISGTPSSLPASDVYAWAKASSKPSYSFTGTAATSGANSGTAVSAAPSGHTHSVTASGTVSLGSNTTAANGIAYVEPSVSGTTLTLTVKYFHPSFSGTAVTSGSNSGTAVSAAPSGHTHSVTATGSVS